MEKTERTLRQSAQSTLRYVLLKMFDTSQQVYIPLKIIKFF